MGSKSEESELVGNLKSSTSTHVFLSYRLVSVRFCDSQKKMKAIGQDSKTYNIQSKVSALLLNIKQGPRKKNAANKARKKKMLEKSTLSWSQTTLAYVSVGGRLYRLFG